VDREFKVGDRIEILLYVKTVWKWVRGVVIEELVDDEVLCIRLDNQRTMWFPRQSNNYYRHVSALQLLAEI
jgi:hypothetical protein